MVVTAATAAMAVVGAVFSSAPAQAADPTPILLSRDGVVWSTTLAGGLFDEFAGAVPGDHVSKTLWVQNPLDEPVTLSVRAVNVWGVATDLGRSIVVDGSAGGASLAAPVTLASLLNCSILAPSSVVPASGASSITLSLAMLDVGSRIAQGSTGGFDVLLTVTQGTDAAGATRCDPPAPSTSTSPGPYPSLIPSPKRASGGGLIGLAFTGVLAFTGAHPELPLAIGGGLVGIGVLLLFWRRRKRGTRE